MTAADTKAVALFAAWARLNPDFDDPELMAGVFAVYRRMCRREAIKAGAS